MIKFFNKTTGTVMWVADDRVEEYKAAGHSPAVEPIEAVESTKPKRTTKKAR